MAILLLGAGCRNLPSLEADQTPAVETPGTAALELQTIDETKTKAATETTPEATTETTATERTMEALETRTAETPEEPSTENPTEAQPQAPTDPAEPPAPLTQEDPETQALAPETQPPAQTEPETQALPSETQPPVQTEPEPQVPTPETQPPAVEKSIYDYPFDLEAIRTELVAIGTAQGLTNETSKTPDSASWSAPITGSESFQGNALKRALVDYVSSMPEIIVLYGGEPITEFCVYIADNGDGSYTFFYLY